MLNKSICTMLSWLKVKPKQQKLQSKFIVHYLEIFKVLFLKNEANIKFDFCASFSCIFIYCRVSSKKETENVIKVSIGVQKVSYVESAQLLKADKVFYSFWKRHWLRWDRAWIWWTLFVSNKLWHSWKIIFFVNKINIHFGKIGKLECLNNSFIYSNIKNIIGGCFEKYSKNCGTLVSREVINQFLDVFYSGFNTFCTKGNFKKGMFNLTSPWHYYSTVVQQSVQ